MKTTQFLWLRIFLYTALFCGITATTSCGQGTLGDAKKLMDDGQYRLSEAVFEALVQRNGQNAETWYWWGLCRLKQGHGADQLFLKAVGLDPARYTAQVGDAYRKEAEAFLSEGNTDVARNFFDSAVAWDNELKSAIGEFLYTRGYYDLAVRYAPDYKAVIADTFFAKGNALTGEASLPYYREAKKYSASHNEAIKETLLSYARNAYEEADIRFWRDAAAEFGDIPPDFKVYPPGTYTFSLTAGEKTDHWVTFQPGVITQYSIESRDDRFQLMYDDGQVVPAWTPGHWPKNKYKFKIIAVTDQPKIVMVVRTSDMRGAAKP